MYTIYTIMIETCLKVEIMRNTNNVSCPSIDYNYMIQINLYEI